MSPNWKLPEHFDIQKLFAESEKAAASEMKALKQSLKDLRGKLTMTQLEQRIEEVEIKNVQLCALVVSIANIFDGYTDATESNQERDLSHFSNEIHAEIQKHKRPNAGAPKTYNENDRALIRAFAQTHPQRSFARFKKWCREQGKDCQIKKTVYYELMRDN